MRLFIENAWISGFSGNTVTVFVGNIQREFPGPGAFLKNEAEISGQIGDLYLEAGEASSPGAENRADHGNGFGGPRS